MEVGMRILQCLEISGLFSLETESPAEVAQLSHLQLTMKEFLRQAPYSDISFEVESQLIPAHKWWLTKRSKYFTNMFSSGMLEAQASKIPITDMTANSFKGKYSLLRFNCHFQTAFLEFLEFLYSDHVELNDALALELLQQADKYSVAELKTLCENYLTKNITPENYVVVGQMSELVDAADLRQTVINFIAQNIEKLKEKKDFEKISDSLLRDSIVKFITK